MTEATRDVIDLSANGEAVSPVPVAMPEVVGDAPTTDAPTASAPVASAPVGDTPTADCEPGTEPDAEAVAEPAQASAIPQDELDKLTDEIVTALKSVYDPEIPVDIYELGLIYKVDIDDDRLVKIDMTLTAPGCPVAGEMPVWVQNAVAKVEGVSDVTVNMVFDPPWDMSRMTDEARLMLNML